MIMKLSELTPLSLGVQICGEFHPVIQRNSPIPVTVTKYFSTDHNNQSEMTIRVKLVLFTI